MRAGVLLLLIGALVAGCSDDESPRSRATPKEPARTTEPAKEPAAPRRSPDLRAQGRDIAWLGRLHRWELNLSDDAVRVETVGRIVQRGGRGEDALRKPLVQLTRCEKNLLRRRDRGAVLVDEWRFVTKEWATYIGSGDLLGFVHIKRPRTSVAPRICKQLAGLVYQDERPTSGESMFRKSEAVAVLAHEAEHMRNGLSRSEAVTECHGMQRMRRLARIMGTSKEYADLLAERYASDLYRYNVGKYKTAACHDGGSLDLHPGSDVWP